MIINKKMKEKSTPNYFKKIGFILACLSFLFLFINHFNPDLIETNEELIKWIFKDILLISLLYIAFGNCKNESKNLIKLKFKALKSAFLIGAGILIFESITEMAFNKGGIDVKSGYEIVVIILVLYLINYYWSKDNKNQDESHKAI